jgi:hypothetical protein
MIFPKTLVFLAFAIGVCIMLVKHNSTWGDNLQQYYTRQSIKMYGEKANWESPWIRAFFRTLIFFFGAMFVLGVYVLLFSSDA